MQGLSTFIAANAQLWATLAFVAGALASWANHARRGLAPWNPFQYWLIDDKPLGWGTLGVIAAGIAGIWNSTVDGSNAIMLTQLWFASGLAVDAVIQPGTAKTLADASKTAAEKIAGFVRLNMLWLLVVVALVGGCMLGGCATGPRAAAPATVPEGFEASNLMFNKISDALVTLSCSKFDAGKCIEPGKPLMPVDSLKIHERAEQAHNALVTASIVGGDQLFDCLGVQRTQASCVVAAGSVLTEIDAYLISLGSKQR